VQVPGKGGATGALKLLGLAAACLCLAGPVPSVASDAYPTRPVRWIVPFTPGGTTDILARIFGQRLSERLGQQFIVENKPGGGANIGTDAVVRSPADGYTLLLVGSVHAINATLYQKLPYNFIRDIAPVVGFARVPNVMEVHPSVPVGSVAEFIAYARSNPGTLNMASSGSGTTIHLGGELFKAMAGVNLLHVPYRGSAPALTDLLSGRVQVMFDNAPSSIAHIRAGKLRALAVTTLERSAAFPDLRGECVVRDGRAKGNTTRGDRDIIPGDRRGARRSSDQGAARRARHRTVAALAGGVRGAHCRRDREVGQRGENLRRDR